MPAMNNRGKIVMVVAPRDYMDEELDHPRAVLEAAGFHVRIACSDRQLATGYRGGSVRPDMLLSEVDVRDLSALVFVGGFGAPVYLDHPVALRLAERGWDAGIVLGGICYGAAVLARARCLEGKRATTYAEAAPHLEAGNAVYTAAGVEVDGRIVTAAGPDDARAFGEALSQLLQ